MDSRLSCKPKSSTTPSAIIDSLELPVQSPETRANAVNEMDGQGDGCMYRDTSRCAAMRLSYLLLQHALGEMNESHYVNASSLSGTDSKCSEE